MAVRSCNQRKRVVYKILNKAYLILHFSMYLEQFFQYFYYRNRRLTVLQKEGGRIGDDVKYVSRSTLLVTDCSVDSRYLSIGPARPTTRSARLGNLPTRTATRLSMLNLVASVKPRIMAGEVPTGRGEDAFDGGDGGGDIQKSLESTLQSIIQAQLSCVDDLRGWLNSYSATTNSPHYQRLVPLVQEHLAAHKEALLQTQQTLVWPAGHSAPTWGPVRSNRNDENGTTNFSIAGPGPDNVLEAKISDHSEVAAFLEFVGILAETVSPTDCPASPLAWTINL